MAGENPRPGQIYRHFKKGLYQIIAIADHTETGERLVVYQALYPDFQIYARPLSIFTGKVDLEKYPDSKQIYRFEKTEDFTEFKEDAQPIPEGVNPVLIQFLDAPTIHEKLRVISDNKKLIDKKCISDLAVSLDITIQENELDKQFEELVSCLNTMKRFEVGRLR